MKRQAKVAADSRLLRQLQIFQSYSITMYVWFLVSAFVIYWVTSWISKRIRYDAHRIPTREGGMEDGYLASTSSNNKPLCWYKVLPFNYQLEINDADVAREVLVTRQGFGEKQSFERPEFVEIGYSKTFGNQIVSARGAEWNCGPLIINRERSFLLFSRMFWTGSAARQEAVESDSIMTEATIDIIFRYLTGENRRTLNAQLNYPTEGLSKLYRDVWRKGTIPMVVMQGMFGWCTKKVLGSTYQKNEDKMNRYITDVIEYTLEKYGNKEDAPLLVQMSRDERYDWKTKEGRTRLMSDANIQMFAGHDTTGHSLAIALYQIAMHPAIQEAIYEEVRKVKLEGKELKPEVLSTLEMTNAAIRESQRLNPVVPRVAVATNQDMTLCGYKLPKNQLISVNIASIHRDPLYFSDPHGFIPQRWIQSEKGEIFEDLSQVGAVVSQMPEIGFTWGTHACLGKNLAMLELRVFLATIIHRYKVAVQPGFKLELTEMGLAHPKNGDMSVLVEASFFVTDRRNIEPYSPSQGNEADSKIALTYHLEVNDADLARELLVTRQGYGEKHTFERDEAVEVGYTKTFGLHVACSRAVDTPLSTKENASLSSPFCFGEVIRHTAKDVVESLKSPAANQEAVEFDSMMTEATIDIIFKYLTGEKRETFNSHLNYSTENLPKLYRDVWRKGTLAMIIMHSTFGRSFKSLLGPTYQKNEDKMNRYINDVIEYTLEKYGDKEDAPLLVQMSRDERYDWKTKEGRTHLMSDANVQVFAGHDTTGHSLSILFYQIALYPDVQEAIYEEIHRVKSQGKELTAEVLSTLEMTNATIRETQRLWPIVGRVVVTSNRDTTVNGYRLKKGQFISINTAGIQRDPLYYPNPHEFVPQRWIQDKSDLFEDLSKVGEKKTKMPEIGFSWGPHACLGKNLAMLELRVFLATIIHRYKVAVKPGFKLELDSLGLAHPKNGELMYARCVHENRDMNLTKVDLDLVPRLTSCICNTFSRKCVQTSLREEQENRARHLTKLRFSAGHFSESSKMRRVLLLVSLFALVQSQCAFVDQKNLTQAAAGVNEVRVALPPMLSQYLSQNDFEITYQRAETEAITFELNLLEGFGRYTISSSLISNGVVQLSVANVGSTTATESTFALVVSLSSGLRPNGFVSLALVILLAALRTERKLALFLILSLVLSVQVSQAKDACQSHANIVLPLSVQTLCVDGNCLNLIDTTTVSPSSSSSSTTLVTSTASSSSTSRAPSSTTPVTSSTLDATHATSRSDATSSASSASSTTSVSTSATTSAASSVLASSTTSAVTSSTASVDTSDTASPSSTTPVDTASSSSSTASVATTSSSSTVTVDTSATDTSSSSSTISVDTSATDTSATDTSSTDTSSSSSVFVDTSSTTTPVDTSVTTSVATSTVSTWSSTISVTDPSTSSSTFSPSTTISAFINCTEGTVLVDGSCVYIDICGVPGGDNSTCNRFSLADFCGATAPYRCPDGSCSSSLSLCVVLCPPEQVRCCDGSCGNTTRDCVQSSYSYLTVQDDAIVTCPDGLCQSDPNSCLCDDALYKCYDGSCQIDCPTVPVSLMDLKVTTDGGT
ncbi:hypothetical protein PROFUN_14647, partial [Planoprotostelium fungivorum]